MTCEADVRLAQQGHKEAFVRLIKVTEGTMYRVAKSMLHSEEAVADAIQDTILKSYSSITSLREPQFFKTWIIRILINRCHQMLKSDKRLVPMGEWIDSVEGSAPYESIELQDLLNGLKVDHRVIVTLYYLEDISIKDIAEILQIPAGTVKSRLSAARKQLMILLRSDGEGRISYDFH
ncbi:RNA polymerase sigma factor SigV [compost metagenome]